MTEGNREANHHNQEIPICAIVKNLLYKYFKNIKILQIWELEFYIPRFCRTFLDIIILQLGYRQGVAQVKFVAERPQCSLHHWSRWFCNAPTRLTTPCFVLQPNAMSYNVI